MDNADKPAFPVQIDDWHGLTKREQFAMAAMQGYIAGNEKRNIYDIAEYSVHAADALLKELAK